MINTEIMSTDDIILSPSHVTLGLMKQLVKALNKDEDCFKYVARMFPKLSTDKRKAGTFDGPQIINCMGFVEKSA